MAELAGTLLDGRVVEVLAGALYRVALDDGRKVIAHVGMALRPSIVRLLPGDVVAVELTRRDPGRGRIVAQRTRQGQPR